VKENVQHTGLPFGNRLPTGVNYTENDMSNWIWAIAIVLVYLALTRWILPKLGVPT
jgi:hypothetical protein